MKYPLVRDLAVEGFPIAVTCGVLGFTRQAFDRWRKRPFSDRDWDDAHVTNALIDAHADDPEFGYRFLTDELADRPVALLYPGDGDVYLRRARRQAGISFVLDNNHGA